MTRTDTFVVGALVVLFALIVGLVGLPSLVPAATSTPSGRRISSDSGAAKTGRCIAARAAAAAAWAR